MSAPRSVLLVTWFLIAASPALADPCCIGMMCVDRVPVDCTNNEGMPGYCSVGSSCGAPACDHALLAPVTELKGVKQGGDVHWFWPADPNADQYDTRWVDSKARIASCETMGTGVLGSTPSTIPESLHEGAVSGRRGDLEFTCVRPDCSRPPCLGSDVNMVYLNGDPDDWIHRGVNIVTAAAFTPMLRPSTVDPKTVEIHIVPDDPAEGLWWDTDFSSRELGMPLEVGLYLDAQREPFADPGHPGLNIHGDGRGCNVLSGRFEVHELVLTGGVLEAFTASWVQHCEASANKNRGCVRYRN